jgi:hypothetical protein
MIGTPKAPWLGSLFAALLPAAGEIYIATQDITAQPGVGNVIATLNPLTGATSNVRLTVDREGRPLQMFDIALDSRRQIWGIDSTQALWIIDPATGICTKRAERLTGGPTNINGLAFRPETGELYLTGNDVSMYRLNVNTCDGAQCAPLVDMSKPPYPTNSSAGDLEFHQGDLYFAGEFGILYRLKLDDDGLWYVYATSEEERPGVGSSFVMKGLASDGETLFIAGDANEAAAPHYVTQLDTERLTLSKPAPITGTGRTLVVGLAGFVPPRTSTAAPPASSKPGPPSQPIAADLRAPARP